MKISCVCLVIAAATLLPLSANAAATVVSVSNGQQLQDAINSVPDGGIIEAAAGTYTAPGGTFTIFPDLNGNTKSFTLRAAQGATVILTGGGGNGGIVVQTTPKLVTFDRINFNNGVASGDYGAAVTLNAGAGGTKAIFTNCTFQNNASNAASGGGGVRLQNATVSFQNCAWTGNTATSFGAGITADSSRIFITGCQFLGNKIDVAGHVQFSAGGAIHANSSSVRISATRFDGNRAAYVGGAIYVFGPWNGNYATPVTELIVNDCTFNNNTATKLSSDTFAAPATGGAVMMEDQTYGRFYNCRFTGNTSRQGGALSSYRTRTEVQNCVFQDNVASGNPSNGEGYGGAIVALSDDLPNASTNNGTINRPSAQLTVTDSLIAGTAGVASAGQGGGIFIAGDLNANYGKAGMAQSGTPDTNRATLTLTRVAFTNLTAANGAPGSGGAVSSDFAVFTGDNLIINNCSSDNQGGALRFVQLCSARLTNSTLANNSTSLLGGGIAGVGGDIRVTGCNFFDNVVTGNGGGKAFWFSAGPNDGTVPANNLTGVVDGCTINSSSSGPILIYDGNDPSIPAANQMQYNNNKIYSADPNVLFTDNVGYKTVNQLNSYAGKSTGGNTAPGSPTPAGAILLVPPRILTTGAPGDTLPLPSQLIYAASGGTATVDGTAQATNTGIIPVSSAKQHTLTVGGASYSTTPLPHVALNISTRLPVGTGDNALIGGFIIVGNSPKRVLVRAIGPSLPVGGALSDTTLQLFSGSAVLAQNDDWATTQTGGLITSSQDVEIAGTGIPPASPLESALIVTLDPGSYTTVVRGKNDAVGVGLVEVYDLDAIQNSTLANISTRGFVQTGDNVMIGGFIYAGGEGATRVVVRGLGPSLAASGVPNTLADPTLDLVNSQGTIVETNDNWQQSPNAAAISAAGLAPTKPEESVVYQTALTPDRYTGILRGKSGTGVGLVEVYIF